MMKNPIGWIEIPVTDMDRAEKFYSDFFGFSMERHNEHEKITMSWFPMDMESYGSAATLMQGESYIPSHQGPLLYFTSPEESVTKGLEKAEQQGIKALSPVIDIGEHGFFALLEDSEGNRIAIHSMKE